MFKFIQILLCFLNIRDLKSITNQDDLIREYYRLIKDDINEKK